MPNHPVAQKLLRALKEPVAAPSANRSGRPVPTRYKDVVKELGRKVDCILNAGEAEFGLESPFWTSQKTIHDFASRFDYRRRIKKIVPTISFPHPEKSAEPRVLPA